MTTITRILSAALAVAALASTNAMGQGAYPSRPVRVVVPFSPGGVNDIAMRIVGERLQKELGQPFLIDNRPGANGNIAAAFVERSAADGYTLLMGNLGLVVHNPILYPKPGFDVANLVPVSCVAETVMVLKVPAESPFKSVADLVAFARANPNKLNYPSVGAGSAVHLGTELLMNRLGFTAVHIPYNGGGAMTNAVMAGNVDFSVDPLVYGGAKVRPLAVLDARRKPGLPDVPTIEEAGFPAVNANSWIGLFAPKGTPESAISLVSTQVAAALRQDAVREALSKAGLDACEGGQAAFEPRIRASERLWVPLLRQLRVRLD